MGTVHHVHSPVNLWRAAFSCGLVLALVACGGGAPEPTIQTTSSLELPSLPLLKGELETQQRHLWALSEGGVNVPPYNTGDYGNTGANVAVAMLDTSIQIHHPDLNDRIVQAWDFIDGDNDPSPPAGSQTWWHGTATSGIVAASANAVGVRGVAPLARLLAYRVVADEPGVTSGLLGDAFITAVRAGAQVVNNSWTHQDNAVLTAVDNDWMSAMDTYGGLTQGPVVVFAAGNSGDIGSMSSFDRYTNDYRVITVGALTAQGRATTYSEPGPNVLLSAPGTDVVTTDLVGSDGVSATDYTSATSGFSGTSAAAPMVSGVVALMLQANPLLNPRDVAWILAKTAASVDCDFCSGWTQPSVSATGFPPFSEKYGFGRVDASSAVAMAKTYQSLGNESQCDSAWMASGAPIPDYSSVGVSSSVALSNCGLTVDRVEVQIKASLRTGSLYNYSGDLHVQLVSPNGLVSELSRLHSCAGFCADIHSGFTFSSVRHMGEAAAGVWTLKVSDERQGHTSTFNGWRIVVHGH